MKSTLANPFIFFDEYLEKGVYDDLKNFYDLKDDFLVQDGLITVEFDKQNHIITFINNGMVDKLPDTYIKDFKSILKSKLDKETSITIQFIEQGFEKRFSDKKEVKAYQNFLNIKINTLSEKKAFNEFPLLQTHINKLTTIINKYTTHTNNYQFIPSFNIVSENKEQQIELINKLFLLLTEKPSMINCSKEEFKNAFTGQEIESGIHWLVLGKNKSYSKPSLFYLINALIDAEYLNKSIINDLNKFVAYVFRDNKGDYIKNIKQSKAYISKNPTSKDRIDDIISSLKI
ncbi:hypothetical protein [Tenacibaculum maritimum]|uniref:hypothetical protein n=1 Tax=Tenacibaculum maritimum TaxID=107401 RepID=UPI003876FCCE